MTWLTSQLSTKDLGIACSYAVVFSSESVKPLTILLRSSSVTDDPAPCALSDPT